MGAHATSACVYVYVCAWKCVSTADQRESLDTNEIHISEHTQDTPPADTHTHAQHLQSKHLSCHIPYAQTQMSAGTFTETFTSLYSHEGAEHSWYRRMFHFSFCKRTRINSLSCVRGRVHSCVCRGAWQRVISALACAPAHKVVSPSFTYSGYQANNVMRNTWAHFNTEDSMTRELMTH